MSWQMAAMAGMAAASTAMQATSAAAEGQAGQSAMNARANSALFDAQQQEEAAVEAQTEAAQASANRQQKLTTLLGSNVADLATRGVGDSPSFEAIQSDNVDEAATDMANIRYMGTSRASKMRLGASESRRAARTYEDAGHAAYANGQRNMVASIAMGGYAIGSSYGRFGGKGGGEGSGGGGGGSVTVGNPGVSPGWDT